MTIRHPARRTSRRPFRGLPYFAAALIAGTTVVACGPADGQPPAAAAPSASESAEIERLEQLNPCADNDRGPCLPVGIAKIASIDALATVGIVDTAGSPQLMVSTTTATYPTVVGLGLPKLLVRYSAAEVAEKIAFYELDGRPGAEIVVPIGMNGAVSYFEVLAVRDGKLVNVDAPGDAYRYSTGPSIWVIPGDSPHVRVVCNDDNDKEGLSLASAGRTGPGRMTDFVSKPGTGAGEAGEWVVSRQTYDVDPSIVLDRSVGQDYFLCEDLRIKSLHR